MPFAAACLLPSAPALLPELTGTEVPEVGPLRAAVRDAVAGLVASCTSVVVATTSVPGSLDGFGRPVPLLRAPSGSWTEDLASRLCDLAAGEPYPVHPRVLPSGVDQVPGWLAAEEAGPRFDDHGGTGLLVLADGSTTRGRRAPGGDDPRGALVDEELAAALFAGRPPVLDADVLTATGCTGAPGVGVLAALVARAPDRCAVAYAAAPLGVGYLVARWDSRADVRVPT